MKNLFTLHTATYFEFSEIENYNDDFPLLINIIINFQNWNSAKHKFIFRFIFEINYFYKK